MHPWKLLKTEKIFEKYSMRIEKRDYKLPDGKVGDFYIRSGPRAACVVALTEDNKVITVRQFRPGPHKILHEIPGGFIDQGESPGQAAARELLEETGYQGTPVYTCQYFEDAYTDRLRYGVVMTGCRKVAEPQLEDREFNEVVLLEIEAFVAIARSGQLTDTATALLGLDFLGLLRSPAK